MPDYSELLPYIVTMVAPPVIVGIAGIIIHRWNQRWIDNYVDNIIKRNRENDPTVEASPLEEIE